MKVHFSAGEMLCFIVPMSTAGATLAVLTTATTFLHKNKDKPPDLGKREHGVGKRIELGV
jgi:hypothetical protein